MQNFPDTIISQYSDSPILCQLITNFNNYVDPGYNIEQFYTDIMNIQTAQGYGLDVWGRIVGVGRVLVVAIGDYLGMTGTPSGPEVTSGDSFDVGIFYSGEQITSNFRLDDQSYRNLIYAKAAANITNGSIPAINYILMNILFFARGFCSVIDNQNMTMSYFFEFTLTPVEVSIVQNSGVLPTPAGVFANIEYN